MLSVDDVCEILSAELLGIVPDDEEVIDTTNRGEPIVLDPTKRACRIYDKIARRLEGEIVPFTTSKLAGFFGRLLRGSKGRLTCTSSTSRRTRRRQRRRRARSAGARSSSPPAKAASGKRRRPQTSARRSRSAARRVVLVDADVGLRNLDIVLGLEARVRYHVLDVLEGKAELDDALVSDKRLPTM